MRLFGPNNSEDQGEPRQEGEKPGGGLLGGQAAALVQTLRQRPLILRLLLATLALVVYLQVVEPLWDWMERADQETATLHTSRRGYERMLARSRTRLAQMEDQRQRLERWAATLPAGQSAKTAGELEKRLRDLAGQKGLEVESLQKEPALSEGAYQALGVRLKASGAYPALAGFLAALGGQSRPEYAWEYSISRGSDSSSDRLRLDCRVRVLARR